MRALAKSINNETAVDVASASALSVANIVVEVVEETLVDLP